MTEPIQRGQSPPSRGHPAASSEILQDPFVGRRPVRARAGDGLEQRGVDVGAEADGEDEGTRIPEGARDVRHRLDRPVLRAVREQHDDAAAARTPVRAARQLAGRRPERAVDARARVDVGRQRAETSAARPPVEPLAGVGCSMKLMMSA